MKKSSSHLPKKLVLFAFFRNWDSLHARLNSHYEAWGYKKKKHKPLKANHLKRKLRLKATKIIGQTKTFYRQLIPGSSCARKETVDADILATSRNGDRKILQSIRIRSRPPSRKRKSIRLTFVKKTSMPNPVKSPVKCYSSSSSGPVKNPSNSIRYNCKKICR